MPLPLPGWCVHAEGPYYSMVGWPPYYFMVLWPGPSLLFVKGKGQLIGGGGGDGKPTGYALTTGASDSLQI